MKADHKLVPLSIGCHAKQNHGFYSKKKNVVAVEQLRLPVGFESNNRDNNNYQNNHNVHNNKDNNNDNKSKGKLKD